LSVSTDKRVTFALNRPPSSPWTGKGASSWSMGRIPPRRTAATFSLALALAAACGSSSGAGTVSFPDAGGASVKVEVADTPDKQTVGLMYRASLAEDRGMWFIFPEEQARAFWMKNVKFPIDIIFVDKEYKIRTIWKSVPPCAAEPCPIYHSGAAVQYVLEVVSGFCERHGVRENQRVTYKP